MFMLKESSISFGSAKAEAKSGTEASWATEYINENVVDNYVFEHWDKLYEEYVRINMSNGVKPQSYEE